MEKSDINPRIQQLYSLLQPYAADAHALLDRWDQDAPLEPSAVKSVAPDEFASLVRSLSELPVGEVAGLLDAAIAADKEGEAAPDVKRAASVVSKVEKQVGSAVEDIEAFAKQDVTLPAPLPSELQEAVKAEVARLERDIAIARARMVTKHDLQILRNAKVPRDTIAAIQRDAPTQDQIDELTKQLEELRQLLAASAHGARLAEQLEPLEAFTTSARELLGPLLDPMVVQQLHDFAQPVLQPDKRRPRRG
jgi:hypothetical protein